MRLWWIAALLAWSLPAQARWLEAESPHFIVYSDGAPANLQSYVEQLEDFDSLLRTLMGTKREAAPNKLRVYLVRGPDGLREIRDVPNEVAGFYIASTGGVSAFAVRRERYGQGISSQAVMFHEYAHHFMMQYYPYGYPAWYVEGFAEFLATAEFLPTRIEVGRLPRDRVDWLLHASWMPSEALLGKPPQQLKGEQAGLFYPQSWLTVHYINRTPGKVAALREFFTLQGKGMPAAKAFETAFGTDFATFDRDLRRYFDREMAFTEIDRPAESAAPQIVLRPMPPSADDLMLSLAHLRAGVGADAKARRLAQVRSAAARYPADPFAERVLAQAEADLGDPAAAIAAADRLLARDPKDIDALVAKATALMAQADVPDARDRRALRLRQAREHLVRANAAAPMQAPILFAYAKAQMASAPPNGNTLDALLAARELAPQVAPIGMLAAYAAAERKDFTLAQALLTPIASDLHGGKYSEAAQKMLEAAAEKRSLPPPDPGDEKKK